MTPAIITALAELDDIGASIRNEAGALKIRADDAPIPDDLRERLKASKMDLLSYLATHQKPVPPDVLFVSKALDLEWVPQYAVPTRQVFWRAKTPFYRLTPPVLAWLGGALDKMFAGKPDDARRSEVQKRFMELTNYVNNYYRQDQISQGDRKPGLPTPRVIPDA